MINLLDVLSVSAILALMATELNVTKSTPTANRILNTAIHTLTAFTIQQLVKTLARVREVLKETEEFARNTESVRRQLIADIVQFADMELVNAKMDSKRMIMTCKKTALVKEIYFKIIIYQLRSIWSLQRRLLCRERSLPL